MDIATQQTAMDVSDSVDVCSPGSVCCEAIRIFELRYPEHDFSLLKQLYNDFYALYTGRFPGFLACDTGYHDIQHVLDVSLAMVRLIDGYDASHDKHEQLGPELATLGVIVALFHDSGYIRRNTEGEHRHGAEYTKIHVSRSAQFLAEYLPTIQWGEHVELADKLVHFTGYEFLPDEIELENSKHRVLGYLMGTADVIAQMADIAYLEKCRDRLYPEFELGGMARQSTDDGSENIIFESAEDLLIKTPAFIKNTIKERLEGHFQGLYAMAAIHFGGRNLYMEALDKNCKHLEFLLSQNDRSLLHKETLRPQ
jgi:hypothetical protein